jgi:hypothetical protein
VLSQLAAVLLATRAALPYPPGERMDFDIRLHGLQMGAARISVGRPADATLPVSLEARATGLGRIVSFRDQLVTFLDVETGLPRVFSLAAQEGGYRHASTTTFDRATNRITVRDVGRRSDTTSVHEVPVGTVDFVALVFALRALPLAPGSRHTFEVLAGTKVASVTAECVGRETISGVAGKTPALKVRVPTTFTGEFREKNPTIVWLTDDPRRIVVRIATDFALGVMTANLVSYEPGEATGRR